MSIYITGDIHGDPERFSSSIFPEGKNLKRDDVVEILGDFGLVWDYQGESDQETYWLDWLEKKPWTTVATLGNHENYDRIEKLPVEERFGGPVWVVRPHVLLLQSGYIYEISGKKIWNFNGAASHDISDGIIDGADPDWRKRAREWDRFGKWFRVKGVSWWPQEVESNESVYERGISNLEVVDYDVDFVWTHCAPTEIVRLMRHYSNDRLTDYLQRIDDEFKNRNRDPYWFFGHYHDNRTPDHHKYLLYEQIVQIA
ncbi:MAG: metallophosphoesterase [Oscillospiraceae bacterium]|nr:metallophosphoesterase [Oscillospiraceae bacterium]